MDRLAALRAFVRLVELGSFSAVAAELRVKQSTVSKWLAALEAELGAQLIARTTRARRTTDAGRRFYARAQEVLAAYDAAAAELRAGGAALRGRLRVSAPVVFGRLFVVPHVTRFLRQHEGLELELVLDDRYVDLVDDGFDVAVRVGVPVDASYRARKLGATRRHLVASPGYVQARGAPAAPRDLAGHACLGHTGLRAREAWAFRRDGRVHRVAVRGRFVANNSDALLAAARAGLGVALLASWLVEPDLRAGRLVALLPEYEPPRADVQALLPPGTHAPAAARALVDALADGFASWRGGG